MTESKTKKAKEDAKVGVTETNKCSLRSCAQEAALELALKDGHLKVACLDSNYCQCRNHSNDVGGNILRVTRTEKERQTYVAIWHIYMCMATPPVAEPFHYF
eukprot:1021612-Amphidinium_carterae.1